MNNNIELKNAILTVLRVAYKYEAPMAFKTVERAGYDIYKSNGMWTVRSTKTWKSLRLDRCGRLVLQKIVKKENVEKVDLVNYLETPVNRAWFEVINRTDWWWSTPTQDKMKRLINAKDHLKYVEADMNKLAKELERARTRYVEATKDLLKERAKLGLLK